MQAMALAAAQSLLIVSSKNTALIDMTVVAPHFALRLTTPPWRQSRSMWPNRRWFSSQASRWGELRAAAQAAPKMNGVVGSRGKNRPKNPSAKLSAASPRSSHCTQRGSGAAAGVERLGVGGCATMRSIVPCDGTSNRKVALWRFVRF